VVDLKRKAITAQYTVSGGEPPSSTKSTGKVYGSKPGVEIVRRMEGMRKTP
jgi:hypothetical protein